MSEIIDLDALVPQPVTIKFDNQTIAIKPPTTEQVLKLGVVGQKLSEDNLPKLTPEEIDTFVFDVRRQLDQIIPELKDKPLNATQTLRLIDIVIGMGMPKDAQELKDRGITVDTPKPAA